MMAEALPDIDQLVQALALCPVELDLCSCAKQAKEAWGNNISTCGIVRKLCILGNTTWARSSHMNRGITTNIEPSRGSWRGHRMLQVGLVSRKQRVIPPAPGLLRVSSRFTLWKWRIVAGYENPLAT